MADFTKTITNNLGALGVSRGQLWGTFLWNTNWGNDEDVETATDKGVTDTLTIEVPLLKVATKHLSNTITFSEDISSVMRSIGIWDYLFTRPTDEATQAVYDEFAKEANETEAWSATVDGSTSWSEV